MTVRFYSSNDAGAPELSGQAGSLTALLQACLVDGYGDKEPAGWTMPFSVANKAAFKMPVIVAPHYLRVDDDAPSGEPRNASVSGFEDMSGIDDGSAPFPSDSQPSLYWRKSTTADTAARSWFMFVSERGLYFSPGWQPDTSLAANDGYVFQLPYSFSVGHTPCLISGNSALNPSTIGAGESEHWLLNLVPPNIAGSLSQFQYRTARLSRASDDTPSVRCRGVGQFSEQAWGDQPSSGTLWYPYPLSTIVPMVLGVCLIGNEVDGVFGALAGMVSYQHRRPIGNSQLTQFDGAGEFSGRSFRQVRIGSTSTGHGNRIATWAVDETGPW